jgi:peptidoglycan/xylan/chitin deacetylase (PgdA/CDA1 family)
MAMAASYLCLMYHNVFRCGQDLAGIGNATTTYWIDDQTFVAQLDEMRASGAPGLSPSALPVVACSASQPWHRAAPVLITFDDGWAGTVDVAGPILEGHGREAFVFITSGLLDKAHFLRRRDVGRLPSHVFTVGSHGATHRLLSLLSERDIREELTASKRTLEDLTGREVDVLSIPGGAVDARVSRIAAESGYRLLFTSCVQLNRPDGDRMAIARVPIRRNTRLAAFRSYLHGDVRREQLRHWALSCPKALLGAGRYYQVRRFLMGSPKRSLVEQA